jgi:hypothetical protein
MTNTTVIARKSVWTTWRTQGGVEFPSSLDPSSEVYTEVFEARELKEKNGAEMTTKFAGVARGAQPPLHQHSLPRGKRLRDGAL